MLRSRGQGSVEFLMAYAWVMVILVIIAIVMWQWGVFDFGNQIKPGSFGFWGVIVQNENEFILHDDGQLQLSAINTAGANLTVLYFNMSVVGFMSECDDPCGSSCITTIGGSPDCIMSPGDPRILELTNTKWKLDVGKRFEANIVIKYNDTRTGEYVYQSAGRIWGNVEP